MNKLIRLKEEHLEYRKIKDLVASNLLGTLRGEVETEIKVSGELPEVIVENIAQKFKKALENNPTEDSERELELLRPYLREEMSKKEIIEQLNLLDLEKFTTFGQKMGKAMSVLKGKVNGKVLGEIIMENF